LKNEIGTGSHSETVIQKLLKDNYVLMMNKNTIEQKIKVAELIVNHQASKLKKPERLQQEIILNKILIRDLVTSKKSNNSINN
jgi:hypothetical protein